ncbi:hypothetical protein DLAC_09912, partial [Tieghemostelium lacteum]
AKVTDLSQVTPGYQFLNNYYANLAAFCSNKQYLVLIEDNFSYSSVSSNGPYTVIYSPIISNATKSLGLLSFNNVPLGEGYFNFTIINSNNDQSIIDNAISYECLQMPYPLNITSLNNGDIQLTKDDLLHSSVLFKIHNWREDYIMHLTEYDVFCNNGILCVPLSSTRKLPSNILSIVPKMIPPYLFASSNFTLTIKHPDGTFSFAQFYSSVIVPVNPLTEYSGFICYPETATITSTRAECEIAIKNGSSLVFMTSTTDPGNNIKRQMMYGTPDNYIQMSFHSFIYPNTDTMYFVSIAPNDTSMVSNQATYTKIQDPYVYPVYPVNVNLPLLPFPNYGTEGPQLLSIQFTPIGPLRCLVTMQVRDDGTGFSYSDTFQITSSYIVSGNISNGIYEFIYDYSLLGASGGYETSITISDYVGLQYSQNYFYYLNANLQKTPFIPVVDSPGMFGIGNFTEFFFKYNNVNTTNGPSNNTMYFRLSHPDPNLSVVCLVLFQIGDANTPMIKIGKYDPESELYSLDFTLQGRQFTGTAMTYTLVVGDLTFLGSEIAAYFPETGNLIVNSVYADEYPPIVTTWQYLQQVPVTINNLNDKVTIGLQLTIEDLYNGFDWGSLVIASNYDPGVEYRFTLDDIFSGNETLGIYRFNLTLSGYCKSDTYSIRKMITQDKGSWRGNTDNYYANNPLQRFKDVNFPSITVNCVAGDILNDTTKPILKDLQIPNSFDIGAINRTLTITFTTEDNQSGINYRRVPEVTLLSVDAHQTIFGVATLISNPNVFNNATYKFTIELPYGFGYPYGIFYQIHGIFDNSLNWASLSPGDIYSLGFPNSTNVEYSQTPLIDGHEPISTNGGDLTIYGRSFAVGSNTRVVNLKIGSQQYKQVQLKFISNVLLVLSNVPGTLSKYTVQVIRDSLISNEYEIVPFYLPVPTTSASPTPSGTDTQNICDEDKTCGGNGQCTLSGCVCNSPWVGKYCGSRVIIIPVTPSPNVTEPSFQNNINGTGPDGDEINFSTLVNIISVRELSPNQTVVFEYKFNQWIYTNITDDFGEQFLYDSNFTKDGVTTNISIIVEWFKSETTVVFANQNLTINPSTMKYKINVSPFKFSSKLNSFQIIMAASILSSSSDSCSVKEFGETSDPNYQYVKLQVNDHSLYGKFIKIGVVDGRVVQINNNLLDSSLNSTESSSQTQSYIGITVPYFKRTVVLDPDFSVLLDTSPASENDNSICYSSNKGLSKSQLAGIIIGAVGFAIVAVAITTYVLYKRKQNLRFQKKIKKASLQ